MAKKYKQFQVLVGGQNGFVIRATNKEDKVKEWIEAFITACLPNTCIKVFQHTKDGIYDLTLDKTDKDVPQPAPLTCAPAPITDGYRPIGFGRW